ncbi:MAG: DNRLRE domain-containing protein [Myxococcota bacterium]
MHRSPRSVPPRRRPRAWIPAIAALAFVASARADTVVIPVSEDSAPYSFVPGLARGGSPTLYAFRALDESSTAHEFATHLWFDVTQADLPVGHVLTQATLVVTYAFDFTGFGDTSDLPATLECREVLAPWSEATLTWQNRPAVDVPFDTITGITAFGAQLCDATPVVLDWITGLTPNEGFALTSPTARVMGMHAREASVAASLKPMLILQTEVPEPASAPALAAGLAALAIARRRGRSARRSAVPMAGTGSRARPGAKRCAGSSSVSESVADRDGGAS